MHAVIRFAVSCSQRVAHLVAKGVVDRLEPVQIYIEDREDIVVSPCQRQELVQAVEEQRPVKKAGERVIQRQPLKPQLRR
jgi:hypothetical protein